MFNCHDFSDGEVVPVTCCIKFKTQEIADQFREALEKAKVAHAAASADAAASAPGETKAPAAAEGAAEGAGDEEKAELDAAAASYRAKAEKRRKSITAQSALADSDYDSNEEDVDEGNSDAIKAKYGIAGDGETAAATGVAAADGDLAEKMAGAKIE